MKHIFSEYPVVVAKLFCTLGVLQVFSQAENERDFEISWNSVDKLNSCVFRKDELPLTPCRNEKKYCAD
jgi:hypothetical protein